MWRSLSADAAGHPQQLVPGVGRSNARRGAGGAPGLLPQSRQPQSGTPCRLVLSLPLGIPGIILGLGFLILAIRTPLYSTLSIILIAYIARFFPFATRTVSAMLLAINPELEQSARASGASWLQTMRYVLVPLLLPAIIAAWLMLFVIFIRELGATILLYAQGTETISVVLVILSEHGSTYVAALAIIQLVLLLGAFLLFRPTRVSLVQS